MDCGHKFFMNVLSPLLVLITLSSFLKSPLYLEVQCIKQNISKLQIKPLLVCQFLNDTDQKP